MKYSGLETTGFLNLRGNKLLKKISHKEYVGNGGTHMTAELEITMYQRRGMVFITDEGHGWLRIPKDIYKLSGYKASNCSYEDNDYVYLEEDVDTYGWFKALTGREWEDFPTIEREVHVTMASLSNPRYKTRMSGEGFVSPFTQEARA